MKFEINLHFASHLYLSFFSVLFVLVSYPPDGPSSTSIGVFPVADVSEGGSVTLTCSSDAAPPVESFAWFKGTGQPHMFTITQYNMTGRIHVCWLGLGHELTG